MLLIAIGIALLVAGAVAYGALRWRAETRTLRARLEAGRAPRPGVAFNPTELDSLPAPVRRYLLATLRPGQPFVAAVDLEQTGTMNMSEAAEQWLPFHASQHVTTHRPGFDWDARIAMLPGMPVHVHDAYIEEEGLLHAAVLGLVSVASVRGKGDIAKGELLRFLAEAPWYPTILLPGQKVQWDAVDGTSARATITDGETAVSVLFRFNDEGMIESFTAAARGRINGGKTTFAPWQGRFWDYATRDGMRIPLQGEVAWVLPTGTKPYWRGRVTRVSYEFER